LATKVDGVRCWAVDKRTLLKKLGALHEQRARLDVEIEHLQEQILAEGSEEVSSLPEAPSPSEVGTADDVPRKRSIGWTMLPENAAEWHLPTKAIREVLKAVRDNGGSATLEEIVRRVDADTGAVSARLTRAVRSGYLDRIASGEYRLPENPPKEGG
jgi:hypothetical protein